MSPKRIRDVLLVLPVFLAIGSPGTARATPSVSETIDRGVDFLVADQNGDGSWGSARQTKGLNIYAPVPGAHRAFRLAVTAMAVSALIDSGRCAEAGVARDALDRGRDHLLKHLPLVRRATPDAIYNVWTHGYGIQALVDLHAFDGGSRRGEIVELIDQQIDQLARYESVDGGWGYYDFRVGSATPASSSTSFTTATCLVALREAAGLPGVEIPRGLLERAVDSVNRQRKPDHSYLYGEYLEARPLYGINRPAGSLGRSQACNFALRQWGDGSVTDDVLDEWLTRLWRRNGWLDIGRKRPVPHEAWFQVAGYFYYYGHYYAARCIDLLPEAERPFHRAKLAEVLARRQEEDGSWWDFPFYSYHKPYGTAFAVMALARGRDALSH